MRHIILSSVSSPAVPYFPPLTHKLHGYRKNSVDIKFVFWFALQLLSKFVSFGEELRKILPLMYIGLHVMYPSYPCQILIKYEFCRQIFEKRLNIKFHENASRGSRVVPCGRTDGLMTLIFAFRNWAKAPENVRTCNIHCVLPRISSKFEEHEVVHFCSTHETEKGLQLSWRKPEEYITLCRHTNITEGY
jgi:hypothetical protein